MANWKEVKLKTGLDGIPTDYDYEITDHRIANQTNADKNANKFFSIELWKCSDGDWRVYTNYGRVDDNEYSGAAGLYGPGNEDEMKAFFNKKFKSKCTASKGYIEIEFVRAKVGSPKARQRSNNVDEDQIPDSKKKPINESVKKKTTKNVELHPTLTRLVDQWYRESSAAITSNAAVSITSDGMETPLGVLTFKQIKTGKDILGELNDTLKSGNLDLIRKLSGEFYSNIPSKLGRKISDEHIISTDESIQEKLDLLQMMEDALEVGGSTFVSDSYKKFLELGIKATPLEKTDSEYQRLEQKIKTTRGHNHYGTTDKVLSILDVELSADRGRYNQCSIDNEAELFHGSRNCNTTGILRRGLLIAPPEAPVSGYMFDKAVYLADQSTKSINYSLCSFPGIQNSNNCFLYIVKTKLGKIKELQYSDYSASKYCKGPNAKFNSVKGCKGPSLIHNEFMVYTLEQATITHVVELER